MFDDSSVAAIIGAVLSTVMESVGAEAGPSLPALSVSAIVTAAGPSAQPAGTTALQSKLGCDGMPDATHGSDRSRSSTLGLGLSAFGARSSSEAVKVTCTGVPERANDGVAAAPNTLGGVASVSSGSERSGMHEAANNVTAAIAQTRMRNMNGTMPPSRRVLMGISYATPPQAGLPRVAVRGAGARGAHQAGPL